ALRFAPGGGAHALDHLAAGSADLFYARRGRRPVLLRELVPQRARQLRQRRLGIGGDAERDRVAAADLPRVVVDLDHAETARERRALGVEEPGEDVGADDQERVALLERAAHAGRRREQTTSPERVVAREAGAP